MSAVQVFLEEGYEKQGHDQALRGRHAFLSRFAFDVKDLTATMSGMEFESSALADTKCNAPEDPTRGRLE